MRSVTHRLHHSSLGLRATRCFRAKNVLHRLGGRTLNHNGFQAMDGRPFSTAGNSTNVQIPTRRNKLLQVGVTPTPATILRSEPYTLGDRGRAGIPSTKLERVNAEVYAAQSFGWQANFSGKRSGCPTVNRVSENKVGSDELERYQRFPPFGLVAQLAERPVVCGRVEGATPFGSAIFSECSSVFRAPGLGPGGRGWKSCRSDHFKLLPWSNT